MALGYLGKNIVQLAELHGLELAAPNSIVFALMLFRRFPLDSSSWDMTVFGSSVSEWEAQRKLNGQLRIKSVRLHNTEENFTVLRYTHIKHIFIVVCRNGW